MEPHEKITQRSRKKIIVDNFLGGISWSIGVWIGATLFIAFFAFILSRVNYVPFVGDFIVKILEYIGDNSFKVGN